MKKNWYLLIIMFAITMLAGCGKETPVSATSLQNDTPTPTEAVVTSEPATPTPTVEVTSEPATPTPTEALVTPEPATPTPMVIDDPEFEYDGTELPESMVNYLKALERTHITPFLNGYRVVGREIEGTGYIAFGSTEYMALYECVKGNKKVFFAFKVAEIYYNINTEADEIEFEFIETQFQDDGAWETVDRVATPKGLTGWLH